ncbi:MAG: DUF624 domain-containing protein [Oscillospiraceae bacterium]|nr:DUF624 domain-containing protein [Oscillospiraceae bacterium]
MWDFFKQNNKREESDTEAPRKKGILLFFFILWDELWELIKLNVIFIAFCIPIVTIPAAITSINKVTMFFFIGKPVNTFEGFFETFKAEWKRASAIGWIYILLLGLFSFGAAVYLNFFANIPLFLISVMMVAFLLFVGFNLFPSLAVLDMKTVAVLKNSALLALLRLPQNILTLVIAGGLSFFLVLTLPVSLPVLMLLYFSLISLITSFCAYYTFKKFVFDKPEESIEDTQDI